jgi:hypothetical protein
MFVSHEPNIFKTAHHGRSRGRKLKKKKKKTTHIRETSEYR